MHRALYEPDLGYYATSHDRPTRAGDFLTAPELHPVFGKAVARQLDELNDRLGRPSDFTVREYGAGRGALRAAIAPRFAYEAVEFGDERPSTKFVGVVVANEFLDALPVHRVISSGGRLQELRVAWSDGHFVEVAGELTDARLAGWFEERGIELVDGQRAEVNLAMLDWMAELALTVERGYVLIFDYGLPAVELYGPSRLTGTLRAFRSHHVGSNALAGVGRQDLTAHIDLDALAAAARTADFDLLGRTTQAEFLVGVGMEQLLDEERGLAGTDWQAQLTLRSSAGRLLDPRQLGGYAVVVLGRGVDASQPLKGLSFRLPRRD